MYAVCKGCGKVRHIVNRTKCLCDECNYRRLHQGLSRKDVAYRKHRERKSQFRVPTGELAMFKEIWMEREHVCVKCGKRLSEPMRVHYFSHIKSKGAYPELRLCKENIEMLCMECHHKYEFGNGKQSD